MSQSRQGGTGTINVYQGYDLDTAATAWAPVETSPYQCLQQLLAVTQNGGGNVDVYQSGVSGLTNLSTIDQETTSSATVYQTASITNNTSSILADRHLATLAYCPPALNSEGGPAMRPFFPVAVAIQNSPTPGK